MIELFGDIEFVVRFLNEHGSPGRVDLSEKLSILHHLFILDYKVTGRVGLLDGASQGRRLVDRRLGCGRSNSASDGGHRRCSNKRGAVGLACIWQRVVQTVDVLGALGVSPFEARAAGLEMVSPSFVLGQDSTGQENVCDIVETTDLRFKPTVM